MTKWTTVLGLAGATALVAAAACTPRGGMESGPGATAADTITGTVRQVGSTPFVRTIVEHEDGSVTVAGPLEAEVSSVVGARVRVWGPPTESEDPRGPHVQVQGYEILSVDGTRPDVGQLLHEPGRGYYLETGAGDELPLAGVPDRLAGHVGAKIWVIRGETGGVQRYGILSDS